MRWLELACVVIVAIYVVARARRDASPGAFVTRLALLSAGAWVGEDSVVRAYGFYAYSRDWSVFLDRVPLLIVVIWPVVIHSAWDVARRVGRDRAVLVPLIGGGIVLADASLIEPIAVASGLWRWREPGLWHVPPIGILGWAFFAAIAMALLTRSAARRSRVLEAMLLAVPAAGSHLLLVAAWWGALRWVSAPVPDWAPAIVAWMLSVTLTVLAVRSRVRERIPPADMFLRIPGALFFFALLALHVRDASLVVYALAFAPPYLALTRFAQWRILSSMRRASMLCLLVSAAGCYVQSAQQPGTTVVSNAPPAVPAAASSTTVWTGRYECSQGATGLTLTVRSAADGTSQARFDFYAAPDNPTVPSGSYTLAGTVRADTGQVSLEPQQWITQPPGYVMVGLSGTMDLARGIMSGSITHPACGAFQLARSR